MLHIEQPKNLVVCTVGDHSLHRSWSKPGHFHTCLIYFGNQTGYQNESDFYYVRKGPKYHLIKSVILENPELRNFDYYWFPDDDIWMNAEYVEKLFKYMSFFKLLLAQPAITGYYSLSITLPQPDSRLRFTNYVENMCPCFSHRALEKCLPTFDENKTGWSYDFLWNELLGHPRRSIGIIDDIIAVHTRPVMGGELYKNCSINEQEARREGTALWHKYSLGNQRSQDVHYGKAHLSEGYLMTVYDTVTKSNEEETPKSQRCWPPVDCWRSQLESITNHAPSL